MLVARHPLRLTVTRTTVDVALKESEAEVLALVSRLAAGGGLLRVEIGGASLEDVFVDLVKQEVPPGKVN